MQRRKETTRPAGPALLFLGLSVSGAVACSDPPSEPRWQLLARGQAPPSVGGLEIGALGRAWVDAGLSLDPEGASLLWVERSVPAEARREVEVPGGDGLVALGMDRPFRGVLPRPASNRIRVTADGDVLAYARPQELGAAVGEGRAVYSFSEREIWVVFPEGEPAPADVRLAVSLDLGEAGAGGVWRARAAGVTGDGLPLLTGQRLELDVELPADSRLLVTTRAVALEPDEGVTLWIELDGEVLLSRAVPSGGDESYHEVELPAGAGRGRLVFGMDGAPGYGVFLGPTLVSGPAPKHGRPDVIVVLADTFRADNMATYGGEPGRTPNLDRFAEGCRRFLRARSPASWTLPAVTSLFTGLYPPQHGVGTEAVTLSDELPTLAGHLASRGYRTAAVTDSGFFSADYGLDRGFEWFQEITAADWSLEKTLEIADRLEARDDGRPLFLVVHTYRTHYPYRQGREESVTRWIELLGEAGIVDWKKGRPPEELAPWVDDFRRLYEDGVRALDQVLGGWLCRRAEEGSLGKTLLVLTSDHGEAFGEHVELGHGGQLWGEKIRVPLLIRGPGIDPRNEPRAASLADLPVTIAAACGVSPASTWIGNDLLALSEDRPLFSFNEGVGGERLSIVRGAHKVLTIPDLGALRAGEVTAAFDLESDPGEAVDLSAESDWPGHLCRELAPAIEVLLEPLATAETAVLSEEKLRRLEALGYGKGEED